MRSSPASDIEPQPIVPTDGGLRPVLSGLLLDVGSLVVIVGCAGDLPLFVLSIFAATVLFALSNRLSEAFSPKPLADALQLALVVFPAALGISLLPIDPLMRDAGILLAQGAALLSVIAQGVRCRERLDAAWFIQLLFFMTIPTWPAIRTMWLHMAPLIGAPG